jgi:5,10-methylenetetrahydromethanopterin reductase
MKISCGLAPAQAVVEHAQLAESLGYDRVWLYDSPAIYLDIWVSLARVAEHTERIGLGTAVLVPSLRHVLATAAAIASIEDAAPGRLACGFGTGATARWTLGKDALSLKTTGDYLRQLRGLLRGEVVEVDGEMVQMCQLPGYAPARPIDVPILLIELTQGGGQRLEHAGIQGRSEVDDAQLDADLGQCGGLLGGGLRSPANMTWLERRISDGSRPRSSQC